MHGILEAYLTASTPPCVPCQEFDKYSPFSLRRSHPTSSPHTLTAAVAFHFLVLDSGAILFKCLLIRSMIREMSYSARETLPSTHKFSFANSMGAAFGGVVAAAM